MLPAFIICCSLYMHCLLCFISEDLAHYSTRPMLTLDDLIQKCPLKKNLL